MCEAHDVRELTNPHRIINIMSATRTYFCRASPLLARLLSTDLRLSAKTQRVNRVAGRSVSIGLSLEAD